MEEATKDSLLGGRVRFWQPAAGYRAAIDPVLLAAAAPAAPGETLLDAGSGAGAASLCLAARVAGCHIVGLEVQPDLAALLRRNIEANGFPGRVDAVAGDLAAIPEPYTRLAFDGVMTNPPYETQGRGSVPPHPGRARAHVEGTLDLSGWMAACARRLRPGGWLAVIHRADRLDGLLAALSGRVGGLVVIPLWPKPGRSAKRVVVLGKKGSRAALQLTPGLTLHEEDGSYTGRARTLLEEASPLVTPEFPR